MASCDIQMRPRATAVRAVTGLAPDIEPIRMRPAWSTVREVEAGLPRRVCFIAFRGQEVRQSFELHRQVDAAQPDVVGHPHGHWREREDGRDASLHELVDDLLGRSWRHRDHRDVEALAVTSDASSAASSTGTPPRERVPILSGALSTSATMSNPSERKPA